jgi:hypothetical protein
MPVRGSARDEKPLRKAIWSAIRAVAVSTHAKITPVGIDPLKNLDRAAAR